MATRLNKIDGGGAHSPARVPPHNLEAEESVLGSCMLSRQAIATALETLTPEDFYKPAHTEMFRIMLDLYARGEPIDAVTMGEELKRQGNLEEFGGKPYLFTLVSSVPSPGSVGHYAKIVVENATLRRLIEASQEIGDLAYALPDDVEQAVDQAEDLIYQVMNRRTSEELAALKDLLTENMELVEKLYERGSAITGVATGFTDLDELTAGLQPSNLIIVAARPSMGKALALDTPIATPTGWITMGQLAPGDEVFDERGRPCSVEAVSPVYTDHDCYRVSFDDGTELVADAGHQWVAWDEAAVNTAPLVPGGTPWARVITTAEMVAQGMRTGAGGADRPRWSIRLADPLDLPEADLAADPYVLGCWLGDQYSGNADHTLTARDRAHFSGEFEHAGYCLGLHAQQACFVLGTSPVRATGAWQGTDGPGRALATELEDLGLGRGAGRATVDALPEDYLWGSFKQRLALLQGLMDAAGTACDTGTVALWLTSRDLIAQVRDLACSLGHCPGPITAVAPSASRRGYCLTWAPLDPAFRMERKAAQLGQIQPADGTEVRRSIVGIRPVPPVPVRCIQVDSPSHLYLAGDSLIPTHNSALALSIAQHVAATDHVPVVIFSLEMSKMELVQRLMCSEARVDSNRLRKGALQDSDWPKLSLALGRLAEAPIFIDDTPNATIMEMRAKCRRVKSKSGLGLVIIDYLQLMAPLKRTDNRVQEVSEISRSLKILARELDVPVIALSQLSRNVEYRADKRPLLADLRESGCVTADTRILRADTGAEVTIGELHATQERNIPVWTMDENLKIVRGVMSHVFSSGVKETFQLRLASGRQVTASANHPFYSFDGMKRLDKLAIGERVAILRKVPQPDPVPEWPEDHLVLLAHLIGDGSFLQGQPLRYASTSLENLEAVKAAARSFGVQARYAFEAATGSYQLFLPAPFPCTHNRRNPINAWLESFGLFNKRSQEKFVPPAIFALPNAQIALFLRHLWATDGHISLRDTSSGKVASIYYATPSPRLAQDVSLLLLRLGIVCRTKVTTKAGDRNMYNLWLGEGEHGATFAREVGAFGPKLAGLEAVMAFQQTLRTKVHHDTVPKEVWPAVKSRAQASKIPMARLAGNVGVTLQETSSPTRTSVARIGALLEAPELVRLGESDIFWDRVVAIEPLGEAPVFDATVLDTHNFVANQTIISNSIEQDADVVMFIYRDEVYNADSPQRGIAELHISKHRSGPIGKVELTFLSHYTKFANLARGM